MPNLVNQISVLGNLRVAGAIVIDKNNLEFPDNPQPGTLAIVGLGLYAYVTLSGIQAWYPLIEPVVGSANYLHTQVGPSTVWTIQHNLNTPASEVWYQIQDSNNTLVAAASLVEIDNSSFELHFTAPQTGTCLLVGSEQVIIDNADIGDGTDVKIHGYANQPLNFVAGNGVSLAFDDNAKSITFNASASGEAVTAAIATETAARTLAIGVVTSALSAEVTARELDVTKETNDRAAAIAVETTRAMAAEASKASASGSSATDFSAKSLSLYGNIIPDITQLRELGSATKRFKAIYVDEAHLSINTLYLGDTPILGTEADIVNIKANPGQSINITTTGVGATLLTSAQNVELSTTGASANVLLKTTGAGSQIVVNSAQAISFTSPTTTIYGDGIVTGNQTVSGGLTVTGNLTVNGTTTTVNSTNVSTSDNIIEINHGQVGNGVSAGLAGIVVDRGDLAKYQFVFDESVDMFKVGQVGNLEVVASQPFVLATTAPIVHSHTEATTSVSGFLSAADKAKLDAMTSGNSNSLSLVSAALVANSTTLATAAINQVVDSCSAATYRSVKYLVQITSGSQYQISELLCIHDGVQPYVSEVSTIFTGANVLASFNVNLLSGNLELVASPVNTGSVVKVVRTAVNV